jgi:hypothetical protein
MAFVHGAVAFWDWLPASASNRRFRVLSLPSRPTCTFRTDRDTPDSSPIPSLSLFHRQPFSSRKNRLSILFMP